MARRSAKGEEHRERRGNALKIDGRTLGKIGALTPSAESLEECGKIAPAIESFSSPPCGRGRGRGSTNGNSNSTVSITT